MGRLIGNALAGSQGDMQGVAIDPEAFKIPDADKYREDARNQYNRGQSNVDYIQPKQRSFLEQLGQAADGQGPSLAVEQLKQAQNRSLAQQMAAAQAARQNNPALAQRMMMQNQMASNANLAAQSTQARIQEQNNARQMYGNQLNSMSGQAEQAVQGYLNQGFSMAQAQQQAAADFQRLSVNQALGLAGINSGIQSANHAQNVGAINSTFDDLSKVATMGASGFGGGGGSTTMAGNAGSAGGSAGMGQGWMNAFNGGRMPGTAPVKGDSLANDILKVKLSPDEIVIPRTSALNKKKAVSFVEKLFESERKGK